MASAPRPFEGPRQNIFPPNIVEKGERKKGEVIPFPQLQKSREELLREAHQKLILSQQKEEPVVATPRATEDFEAYAKRPKGESSKLPHETVVINGPWWDANKGAQRETVKFKSMLKTFTADYWLIERNGSKVDEMVPGTLKEV